jgi:hypothetical protein
MLNVTPETFDPTKLVITDPETRKMTVEGKEVVDISSQVRYRDSTGTPREFYVSAPTQRTFGFNLNYIYMKPEIEENLNGMQVCYPLSSLQTVNNPTEEEAAFMKVCEAIYQTLAAKARSELDVKPSRLNTAARSILVTANADGDISHAVKPLAEYPNIKDTKKKDLTKPKRIYMKLVTKGKGKDMIVCTRVKGPGNKVHNPREFVGVSGNMTPAVQFGPIFWGSHGQTSPHGVSCKVRVLEANFTPVANSNGVPTYDLLSANEDPEEEFNGIGGGENNNERQQSKPQPVQITEGQDNSFDNNQEPFAELAQTGQAQQPTEPPVTTATKLRKVTKKPTAA